jgi:predicted RNA binding protein with dsRBD fold (UPF0201 family)
MEQLTVHVEAEINPTEDPEKVKAAVNNIVGNAQITIKPSAKGSTLHAEAKGQESLVKLRNLLRADRIRDAARKLLFRSIVGGKLVFFLNKQVAFAGHVSFSEMTSESPLGPLRVTVECDNPREVVEWLAEKS